MANSNVAKNRLLMENLRRDFRLVEGFAHVVYPGKDQVSGHCIDEMARGLDLIWEVTAQQGAAMRDLIGRQDRDVKIRHT